ncbi:MAG: polysaccharide deacetylase family protein, partial [Campylobacteraceae bacterium]|nr:polysaccharide deacetylase family protein [Campylobacteraceae bacterium]
MKYIYLLILHFFTLNLFAQNGAVILLYHHVSNTTPASTSVSVETFKKHLNYLNDNDFQVLPLSAILSALKDKNSLPNKSVAITFDDAYVSILDNALPLLKEKGYAFTVFVNTQSVNAAYKNILTWDELKILQQNKGTIGNHTHSHAHMVRRLKNETKKEWEDRMSLEINSAQKILKDKLDVSNKLFAYPYGEYNDEVKEILKNLGYSGLAQQSGAIGLNYNNLEIPRFPMAANHSNMKRFATSVHSKELPVRNVNIGSKILRQNETQQ